MNYEPLHKRTPNLSLLVPAPPPDTQLDLVQLFGNELPVELEIGCGKGAFLLAAAHERPEHNFLGVEWAAKYARYVADRMFRHGLANVRILRTDAADFIRQLPTVGVVALHLYHPDPWPKKRHHKRRLVQEAFVLQASRVLRPNMRWQIQTDHDDYAAWITAKLAAPGVDQWFSRLPETTAAGTVPTNWQIKFSQLGKNIHRMTYVRSPAAWTTKQPCNLVEQNQGHSILR
jgi:tRNA (guanine-N7-)-methyltransferase